MSASFGSLADKVIFVTGASRGIGRSIALRAAADGAKIVLSAKTMKSDPKLPGSLIDTAEEVTKAGGHAFPCQMDVRCEVQVKEAITKAARHFGGLDILVNNASIISLANILNTTIEIYDSMMDINVRGSFLCSQAAMPYLKKGKNPHILYISPPMLMQPQWFSNHFAHTISKYSMSMSVLGLSESLKKDNIAVNALWPQTVIFTEAIKALFSDSFAPRCRRPEVMADAAHAILTLPANKSENTGNFFIDEQVLRANGVTDMDVYSYKPGGKLAPGLYLEEKQQVTSAKPKVSSSADVSRVKDVYKIIQAMMTPEIASAINGTFSFELTGSDPGYWFMILKPPTASLGKLAGKEEAEKMEVRFQMDSEDFVHLFLGKASTQSLFAEGKIGIEGDISIALRLDKLLRKEHARKT